MPLSPLKYGRRQPLWSQFQQHFTRSFFVRNFWAKKYKSKTQLCNFLRQKKQRASNFDEIDAWTPM